MSTLTEDNSNNALSRLQACFEKYQKAYNNLKQKIEAYPQAKSLYESTTDDSSSSAWHMLSLIHDSINVCPLQEVQSQSKRTQPISVNSEIKQVAVAPTGTQGGMLNMHTVPSKKHEARSQAVKLAHVTGFDF